MSDKYFVRPVFRVHDVAASIAYYSEKIGCTRFDAMLCVGAAGSLSETLQLGDIVVGTATIEHDYKLRFVRSALPCHPGSASLLKQLVASFNALDFLEIRCVTDGADADAALSFCEHCSRVMPNVADLIAAWCLGR